MDNYKNRLSSLANKFKTDPPETPIQEVKPVKLIAGGQAIEARFNNWIPLELKKRIKVYCARNDISQKDMSIAALEEYLKMHPSV